jgi:hypothetical protein
MTLAEFQQRVELRNQRLLDVLRFENRIYRRLVIFHRERITQRRQRKRDFSPCNLCGRCKNVAPSQF